MVAASYSAPKLMQLRQAELIGTVHDDGIGNRNVNACFDDGCADKDIEFTPVELAHDAFKLSLAHLPWAIPMRASGISSASISRGPEWYPRRCEGNRPDRRA